MASAAGKELDGVRRHGRRQAAARRAAVARGRSPARSRRTPSASPSGSSPTASRWCSSRRHSRKTRSSSAPSAPAARRSRPTRTSSRPSTAGQVVASGGLGQFSAIDLRKMLTGKVASARPLIGELEEGLTGSASRKDLETMFQLIYLRFTQPRADPAIFGVHDDADQGGAREPEGDAGVRVQRGADRRR